MFGSHTRVVLRYYPGRLLHRGATAGWRRVRPRAPVGSATAQLRASLSSSSSSLPPPPPEGAPASPGKIAQVSQALKQARYHGHSLGLRPSLVTADAVAGCALRRARVVAMRAHGWAAASLLSTASNASCGWRTSTSTCGARPPLQRPSAPVGRRDWIFRMQCLPALGSKLRGAMAWTRGKMGWLGPTAPRYIWSLPAMAAAIAGLSIYSNWDTHRRDLGLQIPSPVCL
jgi:hypothetical protein